MGFFAALLAVAGPLVIRILITLGISVVTYTGMSVLTDQMISYAQGAWSGLPANMFQLAGLAGIGQALSIIFGAVVTRIAIWQATRSLKFLSANP